MNNYLYIYLLAIGQRKPTYDNWKNAEYLIRYLIL